MNPEQWQAVRDLFLEASERGPEGRAELLRAAGEVRPEIAREAALLLEAEDSAATSMEEFAGVVARELERGSTPEHIGRYRVLGVLGDGRSGIVYRVQQEHPAREVALKLLRSTMWSEGMLGRFRNEVQALSLLRHENIARIYDAGTLPEPGGAARPYFVLELVEGKPITEIAAALEMDERRTIELFLQVCDAVEHAHMQGVIHRDLKPGNVLVDESDIERPRIKVIDFGIARILHSDERATLTGQVLGTPGYMSPEQHEGRTSVIDTRTDVYAAGAILRELLLPLAGAGVKREVKKGRLATDLRLILETATADDLERRYQSVSALSGDLRRYLINRPIEARAPTARYTVSKFVRRNRALSGAIAIAAAAIVGMLVMQYRTQAQLRAVASIMLNEVADNLSGRIGAAADRKRILERLLPQIESFALGYPNDVALQNDYAKILGAFGDTLEEESQYAEAMKYFERALVVRERLAARTPDDPGAIFNLSIAVVRVGDLSERARSTHSQKEFYLRALAIDEAAAQKWPAMPNILSNLSFSYERLAALAVDRDLYEEAAEYSRKQIATANALLDLEPESSLSLWGISSALAMKGAILESRRLDAERAEVGREEIRILRQLRERNPGTKLSPKRLVNCLLATATKQASVDSRLRASSTSMVAEAVSIARTLAAADPTEIDATLLHARALCVLSSTLAAQGDMAGAERAMAEAEATADALAARCNACEQGVLAQVTVGQHQVRIAVELKDEERVRARTRALLPVVRRAAAVFPGVESTTQVCHLLLNLPEWSSEETEEALALARCLVRDDPRHRVINRLILAQSLTYAGKLAEAESVMEELRRSIPAKETALLHSLELEQATWKPKLRN